MSLEIIHGRLANTTILFAGIMTLWSFWRFLRKQPMSPNYLGAAVVGEILFFAQGILGLILVLSGHLANLARPSMHILYGIVSLITLPAIFAYTKGDDQPRVMIFYSIGFLFLVFIFLRSIATGV